MIGRVLTVVAGSAIAFGVTAAPAMACENDVDVSAPVTAPVDVDAPIAVTDVLDLALSDIL